MDHCPKAVPGLVDMGRFIWTEDISSAGSDHEGRWKHTGSVQVMTSVLEDKMDLYDDRFEITGEMVLSLAGDRTAELNRVMFAWKLYNKTDPSSIEALVMLIEGENKEIGKVLTSMGDKTSLGRKKKVTVLLRMKKELVKEIMAWVSERETLNLPAFLIGRNRMAKVFDLDNYEVLAVG